MNKTPSQLDSIPQLLDVEDVRAALALPNRRAVWRMVEVGQLRAVRIGKRRLRFRVEDVQAVMIPRESRHDI